ncbi:hypothetical protein MD588_01410 [Photobacterium sp. SDRW27]|uniref:hypothetical protein n=1 Tax=Photobacterium obscurum TaxID=2829490 RepID=UPI0022447BAF|nr:hypothetical protein [Photobacterium obscurum]MCW8327460.1 hypothetical protein [Photobacterium obscurum]
MLNKSITTTLLVLFFISSFPLVQRSPWIDESMLLSNIIYITDFWDYLSPLPLYMQAQPVIVSWFHESIAYFTGMNFTHLRIITLLVSILSLFPFYFHFKEKSEISNIIFLLLLGAIVTKYGYYSTELKQYAFEFISTLLAIYAIISFFKSKSLNRSCLLLAIATPLGISNIIPITIIFSYIVLTSALNKDIKKSDIFVSIFFILWVFVNYILISHITDSQINNNSVYQSKGLIDDLSVLFSSFIGIYGQYFYYISVFCTFYGLIGYKNKDTNFHLSVIFTFTICIVTILKVIGLFPVIYPRHLYWLLPFSLIINTYSISNILRNKFSLFSIVTFVMLLTLFIQNTQKIMKNGLEHTSNKKLISFIKDNNISNNNFILYPHSSSVIYYYSSFDNEIRDIDFKGVYLQKSEMDKLDIKDGINKSLSYYEPNKSNYYVISHLNVNAKHGLANKRSKMILKAFKDHNINYKLAFRSINVAVYKLDHL